MGLYISVLLPDLEWWGEELVYELWTFVDCVLLEVLEDVEIASEGDLVPFEDKVAVDALEVVLLLVLLLANGELDFGTYSFVDYSWGNDRVVLHNGHVVAHL